MTFNKEPMEIPADELMGLDVCISCGEKSIYGKLVDISGREGGNGVVFLRNPRDYKGNTGKEGVFGYPVDLSITTVYGVVARPAPLKKNH